MPLLTPSERRDIPQRTEEQTDKMEGKHKNMFQREEMTILMKSTERSVCLDMKIDH